VDFTSDTPCGKEVVIVEYTEIYELRRCPGL